MYERSLQVLKDRERELREPISEQDDLTKQFLLKQAHQQAPKVADFSTDISFVKPEFFTGPYAIFQNGLHLGESVLIGSIYVENYCSVAVLQVQFGPNVTEGTPNYLIINPKTWRRYPIRGGITSLNIVSNADDAGFCLVVLTTEIWSPNQGELV